MSEKLKILYAAAEVVPFAKTGGLADVAGALPAVLAEMGHDVRIVMPRYGSIDGDKYQLHTVVDPFHIPHGEETLELSIEQSDAIPGVPTYFVRQDYLFDRSTLYMQPDDDHRFIAFCRAVMEMLPQLGWKPDVIHCNDWHTGLIPVYLKTLYGARSKYTGIGSLYTIHNLAYQGLFHAEATVLAGLPWELFTWDQLEYWGQFNFMKAGLVFADTVSTVSETYAQETQTAEYGEGLEGVLASRADDYYGIINGIDYDVWNPKTDALLPAPFSAADLSGKRLCKRALQQQMGLPVLDDVPVISLITRLSSQKGLDLLEDVLPSLLKKQQFQVVVLGTGDAYYHEMLTAFAKQYPEKLALALKFDNTLAHRIYAGSDMFLMPSRYEPCGLGQMIALAYGTIPVVRATGGLADTVKDYRGVRSKGNGFCFEEYTAVALTNAIKRALKYYEKPESWEKVMQNAFASHFSWQHSATAYLQVYAHALDKVHGEIVLA